MSLGRRKAIELPERPRILIMETGLIGELLAITPVLRAIGKRWPEAEVTVMVRPGSAPVLVGSPYVTKLLPLISKERKGFLGVMRLASWVRSRDFDAALVLHTSFRSALITLMGVVPVRAGLSCESRGFMLTHKKQRDRAAYEVDEHLAVAALLGIDDDGRSLDLFLTEGERRSGRTLINTLRPSGRLVGLHPGASRDIRRWPVRSFVELGARLADAGVTPVYFFGPREEDLAGAVDLLFEDRGLVRPAMRRPGNIRMLGAAFELMDAVVTNNTGPMHVAAAVGTRGVFIHGPTPVGRWHPPGDDFVAIYGDGVACRPCDSPACARGRLLCMEAVSVESVFDAVMGLLGDGPRAESTRGAGASGSGGARAPEGVLA